MNQGLGHSRLVGIGGSVAGQTIELGPEPVVLGVGQGCHVQVKEPGIHGPQAQVFLSGIQFNLANCGSPGVVRLNGVPVAGAIVLAEGALVQIGASTFRFVAGSPLATLPASGKITPAHLYSAIQADMKADPGKYRSSNMVWAIIIGIIVFLLGIPVVMSIAGMIGGGPPR